MNCYTSFLFKVLMIFSFITIPIICSSNIVLDARFTRSDQQLVQQRRNLLLAGVISGLTKSTSKVVKQPVIKSVPTKRFTKGVEKGIDISDQISEQSTSSYCPVLGYKYVSLNTNQYYFVRDNRKISYVDCNLLNNPSNALAISKTHYPNDLYKDSHLMKLVNAYQPQPTNTYAYIGQIYLPNDL